MNTDEISLGIAEKEKELLRHNENYALVRERMLELEKKITDLKAELGPLRIATHQSRTAKERIRLEIEILKQEYWRVKQ